MVCKRRDFLKTAVSLLYAAFHGLAAAQDPVQLSVTDASGSSSVELPAKDRFHLYLLAGQWNRRSVYPGKSRL